ncbi:hypothetical protein [Bradyrhizobium liaoningense]|uniref:hypothetical protein n=1 Tax=Bradyrhizobium liaoningense TaxID=43992 RepID=UPI001BAD65FC|nr:hypothetical protein [Bradyrhizobium liaoningense]MBR0986105.1 hypothetical protein [Bradyrhizobium liaoningense]
MIASDCRRDGECGSDHNAQDQGPTNGDGELTRGKGQRARSNSDKQCAEDARAMTICQNPGTECDEKRQGIYCERKDHPAEQTDTNYVENKPNGEHGGDSMCMDFSIAPSTTTTARVPM